MRTKTDFLKDFKKYYLAEEYFKEEQAEEFISKMIDEIARDCPRPPRCSIGEGCELHREAKDYWQKVQDFKDNLTK